MERILSKDGIPQLVRELQKDFDIFCPQKSGEDYVFDRLVHLENVKLDYSITILPPSRILIRSREVVFSIDGEEVRGGRPARRSLGEGGWEAENRKILLFGVHLGDLQAIEFLDEILKDDPIYQSRRKMTVIIGVDFSNHPEAFFWGDRKKLFRLCDVFLDDIGDKYLAVANTNEGKKIVASEIFEKTRIKLPGKQRIPQDKLLSNPQKLKKAVLNQMHDLWLEMGKKCLACGICTYVCPLCFCFDTNDRVFLDNDATERSRSATSCFLADFHRIAGPPNKENRAWEETGHCFNPTVKDRFYFWYYHKFVRMVEEYGRPGCIGCGRCSLYCPAGINIKENLTQLLEGV